jgi:hypothetical protein
VLIYDKIVPSAVLTTTFDGLNKEIYLWEYCQRSMNAYAIQNKNNESIKK